MAHAYQSAEDGQIVISDEPRPDLEALARWQEIDVDEAQAILDSREAEQPIDEDSQRLIDFLTEHDLTAADVLATLIAGQTEKTSGEPITPPAPPAATADPQVPTEAPAGNASTEKWAEYARTLGITVAEDATREAIKAAIDAHKAAQ